MMNDQILASACGGSAASVAWNAAKGFFRPTKLVVGVDGPLTATVGSAAYREMLPAARVVQRPKQIARVVGTTAAGSGVVAGSVALGSGQGAEGQTPSIEQLTGLE